MNKTSTLIVSILLMLLTLHVYAASIKGVEIPERITQTGTQSELVLNGTGIRTKFIFDIYVGSLYLTSPSTSAEEIMNSHSAKRISMHILYDRIEKEKMTNGWNDGFKNNLTSRQFTELKSEIEMFNSAFGDTLNGDEVILDFLANNTTKVTINNLEKARINSANFQRALLSIWLGEDPVDEDLKMAMLGLTNE